MNCVDELICHLPTAAGPLRELGRHPLLAGVRPVNARVTTIYYDSGRTKLERDGWRICLQQSGRKRQLAVSHAENLALCVRTRRWWSTPWAAARARLASPVAGVAAASEYAAVLERLPDALPDLPRAAREAWAAARPLGELCTARVQRTCWRVEVDELLIDVVLERGQLEQGTRLEPLCTLSLVACEDRSAPTWATRSQARTTAGLLAFALALQQTVPLRLVPRAGSATACLLPAAEIEHAPVRGRPVELDAAHTPREALVSICRNVAQHWLANQAGARETDDSEYIHQLRVALRRLKTALKIFSHCTDPANTAPLQEELSWFTGLLGAARDWDVLIETSLPPLMAAGGGESAWQAMRAQADAQRKAARDQVRAALDSPRYACLTLAFLHWVARLAQAPETEHESLRDYAQMTLRKHRKRLRNAPDLSTLGRHERHRQRIHAKRLRYTLEFFGNLLTKKTRVRMLRQVGKIQDLLGIGNDAAVASKLAEQLESEVPEDHGFTSGFAQGWFSATELRSANAAQGLLHKLPKPELSRHK